MNLKLVVNTLSIQHLHLIPSSPAVELISTEALETLAFAEPLRSASEVPRFTKVLEDGMHAGIGCDSDDHVAVIDNTTGLMWSVESLGDAADADSGITHKQCVERCRELKLLGFDDWRLPTRAELAALIDDTRHEPAIDTNFFPRVKSRWHWTDTPCAWSSASAWYVYFYDGLVDGNLRGGYGFALAVRRAGQ